MGLQNKNESIFRGAIQGAMAWTVYAIVECGFSSILPWIIKPSSAYIPLHWGFTVLLPAIYLVFGLVLGGLWGLCASLAARRVPFLQEVQSMPFFSSLATFSIIVVFVINLPINYSYLVLESIGLSSLPVFAVAILLTIGLALSAGSNIWFGRLRFFTNPLSASILLLGLPWINGELAWYGSTVVKAGAALGYCVSIVSISYILQRVVWVRRASGPSRDIPVHLTKSFVQLGIPLLIVLGFNFLMRDQALPVWSPKSSLLTPDAGRPNIVLIIMDTVRADHLSLYGYERDTTPNLEKFSQEATTYSHAIAPSDITLSSHASIFTGMYPSQHGANFDPPRHPGGRPLADTFHTLPQILSEMGYLTMGVVANYGFLGPSFKLNRGFDYYDARAWIPFLGQTGPYFIREGVRHLLARFISPYYFDMRFRRAELINGEVFRLLEKVHEEAKPFFLFINYMDTHWAYIPPHPFDKLYPGKDGTFTTARFRAMQYEVMTLQREVKQVERNHIVSQYDGSISYLDFQLSKLIAELKKLGKYENCLIIITSDHGETFGEKHLLQHGSSVYQNQVGVPLIIKYPHTQQKVRVDEPVSLVDIMPTVLDALGRKFPAGIQGQSLVQPGSKEPRILISESFENSEYRLWHGRFRRIERAIFSGPLKFISSTKGKRELYDLSKDPSEKENLYNADSRPAKEFDARLSQWLASVNNKPVGSAGELDRNALERLRSLGYIR